MREQPDRVFGSIRSIFCGICGHEPVFQQGSGPDTPVFNIYVGGKKITDVVIEEVNRRTSATGSCPILT